MGLDINALRFLLDAKHNGTSFEKTITLGRQTLFATPEGLMTLPPPAGRRLTYDDSVALLKSDDGFCEPFLRLLGAEQVHALDVSSYQRASIVHDMNLPIPSSLQESCTAVVDGGTLEHVFDVRQALKNCMEMVCEGGHFIAVTPTNNFMGHGFYQFSPELFYRVFGEASGYTIERMLIYEEDGTAPRFFDVADPARVRRRVALVNRHPSSLLVRARRVAVVPVLATPPQQSDYVPVWSRAGGGSVQTDADRVRASRLGAHRLVHAAWTIARPLVPAGVLRALRSMRRGPNAFDPRSYREASL